MQVIAKFKFCYANRYQQDAKVWSSIVQPEDDAG